MPATPYAIFLDTQVFEAASFNFKMTALVSLVEQVQKGTVRLILTDITVREVKARIEKVVAAQLEGITKFKRNARVLRSSALPEAKAVLDLDEQKVVADLHQQFDEFLRESKSEIIDTSALPAGPVFEQYFAGKPPFGSGDKKSEFPDAFVVEALGKWAKENGALFVISGDEPFRDACRAHDRVYASAKLSTLLDRIMFDAAIGAFIREQTLERIDDIREQAKEEFQDRMYNVDDEWGDAEMVVQSLELEGEPEILEADEDSATVEVHFQGKFDAHLSYDDSSSGVYDSETKSQMFMERRRETQELEEEFVVEVKVKFKIFDPDSFEIEEVALQHPDESYSVPTSRWAGFPWK
jgi:hypothetical protein